MSDDLPPLPFCSVLCEWTSQWVEWVTFLSNFFLLDFAPFILLKKYVSLQIKNLKHTVGF